MTPRLPIVTPQQVIRALKRYGFVVDHQTGGHIYLRHETKGLLCVPFHRRDLKRGTLKSILRSAEISVHEFMELL